MVTIPLKAKRTIILLTFALLSGCQQSFAQELPKIDLLKLNESKPALSNTGEGVASYKISALYSRGTTKIVPLQPKFKIQLPIGYSLFKDLIYLVQTDVQAVGPTDVELRIPSAETADLFGKLRILYADTDDADLEVPKWIDGTVSQTPTADQQRWLTAGNRDLLQPNFETRTLHAFMEDEPTVFVVAVREPKLVRDRFMADLKITGSDVQTMEGRVFSRTFKITNSGPDTANVITLHAERTFDVVSMKPTVGSCRVTSGNIYCRVPELKKDQSIEVVVVEQCPWVSGDTPPASEGWKFERHVNVSGAEQDPHREDNETFFVTRVLAGTNKSPVATVNNIKLFQIFPGPSPNIPIRVTASDPDGTISKVEAFEEGERVANGTLVGENEYELIYKPATLGRHRLQVKVSDNLGRYLTIEVPELFVNGRAEIEIVSPEKGAKLDRPGGDLLIKVRARNGGSPLKKVAVNWQSEAEPIGNDQYLAKLHYCGRRCEVQAFAFDADGIETRSEAVEFTLMNPPEVTVRWFDGEYIQDFELQREFKLNELVLVGEDVYKSEETKAPLSKMEYFVDGILICTKGEQRGGFFDSSKGCIWKVPSSGQYKVQAVATNEDGMVGRSRVVEVTIQKP